MPSNGTSKLEGCSWQSCRVEVARNGSPRLPKDKALKLGLVALRRCAPVQFDWQDFPS